jgi:hypothetical protein
MASKRQLKGDICFIVKEMISECIAYTMLVPNVDIKATEDLINDILDYYGKALTDINAVRKNKTDERGDNLKAIRNDVRQKVAEFVGRMAKLSESK